MADEIFCARRLVPSNLGWFLQTRHSIGEDAGRERAININRDVFDAWFPENGNQIDPIEITTKYFQPTHDAESFPSRIHSDQRTIRSQGGHKNWRLAGDAIRGSFYDMRPGDLLIMLYDREKSTLSWLVSKGPSSADRGVSEKEQSVYRSLLDIFGPDRGNMWLLSEQQQQNSILVLQNLYSNIDDLFGQIKSLRYRKKFQPRYRKIPNTRNRNRKKIVTRSIAMRQGQPAFRDSLLDAYESKCAITGCSVTAVLEAAHIIPYAGKDSNHVQNGLLLRADIHSLFDVGLLAVNPVNYKVLISRELLKSEYANHEKRQIFVPEELSYRPSAAALDHHLKNTYRP